MSLTSVMCQLQGAGAADAGGDHGDAHLLRPGKCEAVQVYRCTVHKTGSIPGLCRGEGRAWYHVRLDAHRPLLGHHHHDLCGLRGHPPRQLVRETRGIRYTEFLNYLKRDWVQHLENDKVFNRLFMARYCQARVRSPKLQSQSPKSTLLSGSPFNLTRPVLN